MQVEFRPSLVPGMDLEFFIEVLKLTNGCIFIVDYIMKFSYLYRMMSLS